MDIDPVLNDNCLVTSRMTHQPAESRFLLYHTTSTLRDDRASVYDDRATGAFDHGPVREGSAALARIGGVIRPLVDALRSGDFDSHGSSDGMSRVARRGSSSSTRCMLAAMRVVSLCRHVRLQRATVQHEECRPAQPCQLLGVEGAGLARWRQRVPGVRRHIEKQRRTIPQMICAHV